MAEPAITGEETGDLRLQYRAPTLTRYGSVRNLTGGSCGLDIDNLFTSGNPIGNDDGVFC